MTDAASAHQVDGDTDICEQKTKFLAADKGFCVSLVNLRIHKEAIDAISIKSPVTPFRRQRCQQRPSMAFNNTRAS